MMLYKEMSYVLLAVILFANSFAFPDRHFDPIIEQRSPPVNDIGSYDPCPFGATLWQWTLEASWCLNSKNVARYCVENEGPGTYQYTRYCGWRAYCQGSRETDPDPRTARCVMDLKRTVRFLTNRLKGSAILQCVNFKATGVTGADGIGVQATAQNPSPNEDPPMPVQAQLFYQGASSPIQAMDQSSMNDISGYFIFNNVIDYKQGLQFCVGVAFAVIVFTIGYLGPKTANSEDFTFITDNKTVYKTFDDAAGIWREVQLDVEE